MEEIGKRSGRSVSGTREMEESKVYRKTTPIRELEVYMPVREASPYRAKQAQAARKSAQLNQKKVKSTRNLTELRERIPEADETDIRKDEAVPVRRVRSEKPSPRPAAAGSSARTRTEDRSGRRAAAAAGAAGRTSSGRRGEEGRKQDAAAGAASGAAKQAARERTRRNTAGAAAVKRSRKSIKRRMRRQDNIRKAVMTLLLLLICVVAVFGVSRLVKRASKPAGTSAHDVAKEAGVDGSVSGSGGEAVSEDETEEDGAGEAEEEPEPVVEEVINFEKLAETPHAVSTTTKDAQEVSWNIYTEDGEDDTYHRNPEIEFGLGRDYNSLPGICTFRGDNFRSGAAYGTADITEKKFSAHIWTHETGGLSGSYGGNYWSGSGWTGQCLIREWDEATRKAMNLYEDKKAKDGLVEVIYATLDGTIYFYDLEDGKPTRDTIYCGMAFKGAGALDPRGYPLMYVGAGDNIDGIGAHMFIISLIDGQILWEYGDSDPVMLRYWTAFDSSPLVDAETDTLIWPGESGVFYTIKLNSNYNASAGTISISPQLTARSTYMSPGGIMGQYIGMEDSVAVIGSYAYVAENSGKFFCIDLNTMDAVWVQDTMDDNNSTPAVEFNPETGEGYVYSAPSLHWTAEGDMSGQIGIYKMNAVTGEIVWKKDYDVWTVDGVSGGVQGSPAVGKAGTDIENLIIYPIARTPNMYDGKLVALDKKTGEEVWVFNMENYAWSSPVTIYDSHGKGYVVIFDSGGSGFLLDGATGEKLDTVDMGSNVEASPCVYNDSIVVGTRGNLIICVKVQ